jgi:feruloyl esterase
MEAQRFPWDFDGIVAGAPDIDEEAANLRATWIARNFLDERGKPLLSREALKLAHEAALARCDMDDGIKDGVIGNPFACKFDPAELICKGGRSEGCLTAAQANIIKRLYEGPTTSKGENISTGGFLRGSELGWEQFWPASAVEQYFKYGTWGYSAGPEFKYTDFDFDRDYKRFGLAVWYDNSNPDLRKFKRAGGKLIVYHGGTDTVDLPGAVTDYYETVERTMGGGAITQEFFRLFFIPGMNHCSGGAGAYTIDFLSYLETWVERGKAPAVLVGAHVSEAYLASVPLPELPELPVEMTAEMRVDINAYFLPLPLDPAIPVSFTRPVYPYPTRAKYLGHGNPNSAASFGPTNGK